jgi:hypothetical protein
VTGVPGSGPGSGGAGSADAGSAGRARAEDLVLRVAGTVAGLLLGFLTALWEIFLSPLYAGRVPLPVSPILAVLTSLGLVWFTRRVTGRNGLALLPGVVWFGTMVVAANRTHEGDVLLPGNDYMGLIAILLGCAAWGLAGYRMVLAGRSVGPYPAPAAPAATAPAQTGRPAPGNTPAAPKPGARPAPAPKPGAKPVSAGRAPGRRRPSGPSGRQ